VRFQTVRLEERADRRRGEGVRHPAPVRELERHHVLAVREGDRDRRPERHAERPARGAGIDSARCTKQSTSVSTMWPKTVPSTASSATLEKA